MSWRLASFLIVGVVLALGWLALRARAPVARNGRRGGDARAVRDRRRRADPNACRCGGLTSPRIGRTRSPPAVAPSRSGDDHVLRDLAPMRRVIACPCASTHASRLCLAARFSLLASLTNLLDPRLTRPCSTWRSRNQPTAVTTTADSSSVLTTTRAWMDRRQKVKTLAEGLRQARPAVAISLLTGAAGLVAHAAHVSTISGFSGSVSTLDRSRCTCTLTSLVSAAWR